MARRLGTIMVDMGYLDEETLWKVLEEQKRSGSELLGKVAVRMGIVKEDQVLKALGEQLGMKVVRLADITIPAELTEMVNESMATAYKIVPVSVNKKDKSLTVAMAEPQNPSTLDSLRMFLSTEVKGAISTEADVMAAIERLYAGHHESIQDVVKQIEQDKGLSQLANRSSANTVDLEAIEEMAEAAPVRKLLNMVLLLAIKDKASDIHFEPFEEEYKMRYRVDGVLYELVPPPRAPCTGDRQPHQGHVQPRYRRAPAAPGRPDPARTRRQRRRYPGLDLAVHVRRKRRPADPRPHGRAARPEKAGHARRHAENLARDHREAQRHHPGDGPDLVGQDDDPVRHPQPLEPDRRQDHHHRRAGRVRHRGPDSDPGQPRDRRHVRRLPAVDLAARPGQDPGGRNARPRDGRDLDPGLADRPHRLHHPAHQRRPVGDHPAARYGPAHVLDHGHRRGGPRPAAGAQDLRRTARPSSCRPPRSAWSWA